MEILTSFAIIAARFVTSVWKTNRVLNADSALSVSETDPVWHVMIARNCVRIVHRIASAQTVRGVWSVTMNSVSHVGFAATVWRYVPNVTANAPTVTPYAGFVMKDAANVSKSCAMAVTTAPNVCFSAMNAKCARNALSYARAVSPTVPTATSFVPTAAFVRNAPPYVSTVACVRTALLFARTVSSAVTVPSFATTVRPSATTAPRAGATTAETALIV